MPPSISTVLRSTTSRLTAAGVASPEPEASWLLSSLLDIGRADLHLRSREIFPSRLDDALESALRRRCEGEPLQYILGETEFYALPFSVSPDVLIPRPETECLVDRVLERLRESPASDRPILDVGTGSGAIAVALAHELPSARLIATDLSPDALRQARRNADRNGVGRRIAFVNADALAPFTGASPFRAVVSNPPYIPTPDLAALPDDVRRHEPEMALDGGPDGLDVIRKLLPACEGLLEPGGWMALEVDSRHADAAAALVGARTRLMDTQLHVDLNGLPRLLMARKPFVQ